MSTSFKGMELQKGGGLYFMNDQVMSLFKKKTTTNKPAAKFCVFVIILRVNDQSLLWVKMVGGKYLHLIQFPIQGLNYLHKSPPNN